MTAGARQRRLGPPFGNRARTLMPFALLLAVSVLFVMVWQTVGEQSDYATSERNGVRYIQALGPLEIALTNAESAAVTGDAAPRDALSRAIEAVAAVDKELGGDLRTQDRWAELRTKIEALPASGAAAEMITAYGGANELLLALTDKVRNTSKLIRDPEADTYYLEDGAAQELPEGIVAAARYTDLLLSVARQTPAEQAKALVDITSARSDVTSNSQDLSDDVRQAVDGADSGALGIALLTKLDRFNRSIDGLAPLMTPLQQPGKGSLDAAKVSKARDETQTAAADLSTALLAQIDVALRDRISSLGHRRLLAIAVLVVSVLLVLAPVGLTMATRRRRPAPAPAPVFQEPAPAPAPTSPPAPTQAPAQWPDPGPYAAANSEYTQWERFGASQ